MPQNPYNSNEFPDPRQHYDMANAVGCLWLHGTEVWKVDTTGSVVDKAFQGNGLALAITSDACIWVCSDLTSEAKKYNAGPNYQLADTKAFSKDRLATDSKDCIWSVDRSKDESIIQYNQQGIQISSFEQPDGSYGKYPAGIAVDSNDCIWTTHDAGTGSLFKMDQNGSVAESLTTPSNNPYGIAFDGDDCIWLIETNPSPYSIYKLDKSASEIDSISVSGLGPLDLDIYTG